MKQTKSGHICNLKKSQSKLTLLTKMHTDDKISVWSNAETDQRLEPGSCGHCNSADAMKPKLRRAPLAEGGGSTKQGWKRGGDPRHWRGPALVSRLATVLGSEVGAGGRSSCTRHCRGAGISSNTSLGRQLEREGKKAPPLPKETTVKTIFLGTMRSAEGSLGSLKIGERADGRRSTWCQGPGPRPGLSLSLFNT